MDVLSNGVVEVWSNGTVEDVSSNCTVEDVPSNCTVVDDSSNEIKKLKVHHLLICNFILTNEDRDWWCHRHANKLP